VPRPLPAFFFQTEAGREPVREWLKNLPSGERKIIGEDIMNGAVPLASGHATGRQSPTRIARILSFVRDEELDPSARLH